MMRATIQRWLREPLVHFVVLGALLFVEIRPAARREYLLRRQRKVERQVAEAWVEAEFFDQADRVALDGPLSLPRGADSELLGERRRKALLLLRVRQGR